MNVRLLLATCLLALTAIAGVSEQGTADADSSSPTSAHPYSDPIWWPLREAVRVSCVKTNCPGPYHGYEAIDLAGELGDPIYPAGAGVFHIGGIQPGCTTDQATRGTWVWIDHGPAGSTRYHHLDSITAAEGQLVTPETQIGRMGHSGDKWPCETNYLHMEFRTSQDEAVRHPIPSLRACTDSDTIQLPEDIDHQPRFSEWDEIPGGPGLGDRRVVTPFTDDTCLPATWSTTPDRPGSVALEPGVAAMDVSPPARPVGVDAVRLRLELFHPSLDRFGRAVEMTIPPDRSTGAFTDLLPNRLYRALSSYHNSSGWSAWSVPVEADTGFLPVPPEFREQDSSHTTIGYKWHRGSNADADYTVAIRRAAATTWGEWEYHEVSSPDVHFRFRDLDPDTKYQITVRSHNEFGTSDWAPRRTFSTLCATGCAQTARVFTPLTPARFADSRNEPTFDDQVRDTGPRSGGSIWEVPIAGRGGVPADATAAVVNLTLLNGVAPGFATVYPCGDVPNASSVNYGPGSIEPNEVIAKLSPSGTICVFNLTTADVIVDVVGHVTNSSYRPLSPARYADSRDEPTFDGAVRHTGRREAGSVWRIPIAGRGSVPEWATTAAVNVTVTGGTGAGFATVYPCGERPQTSSLNWRAGITRPNELVTKLSSDGAICVYTLTDVDVIVDVVGFLGDVAGFTSLSPIRLADSRDEPTIDGGSRNTGRRPAGSSWEIPIEGRVGLGDAHAVIANVTVTDAIAPGFVTVYGCGPRPDASSLNYFVGTTRPNETIAKLSATGALCVYTLSAAHIIVDVVGVTDEVS